MYPIFLFFRLEVLEDVSTRQEVYKLIIEKKDNKEIATALNISVRTVERYRKDFNNVTNDNDKTTTTSDNKKKEKRKSKGINNVWRNNSRSCEQSRISKEQRWRYK